MCICISLTAGRDSWSVRAAWTIPEGTYTYVRGVCFYMCTTNPLPLPPPQPPPPPPLSTPSPQQPPPPPPHPPRSSFISATRQRWVCQDHLRDVGRPVVCQGARSEVLRLPHNPPGGGGAHSQPRGELDPALCHVLLLALHFGSLLVVFSLRVPLYLNEMGVGLVMQFATLC